MRRVTGSLNHTLHKDDQVGLLSGNGIPSRPSLRESGRIPTPVEGEPARFHIPPTQSISHPRHVLR